MKRKISSFLSFFSSSSSSSSSSFLLFSLLFLLSSLSSLSPVTGSSTPSWYTALTSNIDDGTFHYYSPVWTNSTPFNTLSSSSKNSLFESYSTIYVQKVRITMDGTSDKSCGRLCTYTFSLPDSYSGSFTLMELVNLEGGIDMTDDRNVMWINTNKNYFKFQGSASKYYDSYYTHEMAFNYGNYDRAFDRYPERPRARLGIMMSFFRPNGEWRAAEGIGLTFGFSRQNTENVGSGRVESYNAYLFRAAKVEVYGISTRVDLVSTYTSPKINGYGRFPVQATNFNSSLQSTSIPRNSLMFMFRLKRKTRNVSPQIYRIGTSLSLGHLFLYTQSEGAQQPYYDGRHWVHHQATTYSLSEGLNSIFSSFTTGQWHHIAFTTDLNRRTVWIDGFPMVAWAYYRGQRVLSYNEELFQLGTTSGAIVAEISDFRFFQRELSTQEMIDIRTQWIDHHKGCGDGERDLDEECDDGNARDGDGCSKKCLRESGYVCTGGNTTSISPDSCVKGSYSLSVDFESYRNNVDASEIFAPSSTYKFSVAVGWNGWDMTGIFGGINAINMALGSTSLTQATCSAPSQGCCDSTFGRMIGGLRSCGNGCQLASSFKNLPSHNYVRITVQIAFIDNWSNEWIFMFADNALRMRVQKTSSLYPVHKSEACLPTVGGGSFICRVSYCGATSVADDLATYDVYFFHNKSTLDLRFSNSLNSATSKAVGFTYLNMAVGTSADFVFQTEGVGTLKISDKYSQGGKGLSLRNYPFPSFQIRTGSSYSQILFLGKAVISPLSFLEFRYNLYRIPWFYGGFYVTLIRTNKGVTTPLFDYNLQSCPIARVTDPSMSAACAAVRFYRICYDSTYEPNQYAQMTTNYCDERQYSNLGSWYLERVDISEKFKFKYGFMEGAKSGQFHVQFGVYGDYIGRHRDVEVYLDDIKIGTPTVQTPTCPQLDVSANQTGSTFSIGGRTTAISGSVVPRIWNVVSLDPNTHSPLTSIQNMDNTGFYNFVSKLPYGSLIMYAHTGPIICNEAPSANPTTAPSSAPSRFPSNLPTLVPTSSPSLSPSIISVSPTLNPSASPSIGTLSPSRVPSFPPSRVPSFPPSRVPSFPPSRVPSLSPSRVPSRVPTFSPTRVPTFAPTPLYVVPAPLTSSICNAALSMIGGTAVTLTNGGGSQVSVAGIGFAGVGVGNMPFVTSLWSDGTPAKVSSYVGCHSRNASLGENAVSEVKIGSNLLESSQTYYFVDSTSFGFVGCYVRGNENELFSYGYDNGFSLTAGSCALVCHDAGFPYSRVLRTECICSDAYGQATSVYERNVPVSDNGQVSAGYCLNINQRLIGWWEWGCRGDYSQFCAGYTYGAWYQSRSSVPFPSTIPISITCKGQISAASCRAAFDYNFNTLFQSNANVNATITINLMAEFIIDNVRIHTGNVFLKSYEMQCGRLVSGGVVYESYGFVRDATIESNLISITNIEALGKTCQYLNISLISSSGNYHHLRDIRINYFPSPMLKQRADKFSTTYTRSYYNLSRSLNYRADSYANSILPVVEARHMFSVDIRSGQLWLARARLDFESLKSYHVRVVARINDYNSGWFTMSNTMNFFELKHNLTGIPWNIRVNVQVISGPNQGFIFDATGAIMVDGSEIGSVTYGGVAYPETYGGLLFAYNERTVRLWAPSGVNGFIINVRGGWGQVNLQSEVSASVSVRASTGASPQYDSGWVPMRSQSSNPLNIQRDFYHPISNIQYAIVKVYYRPTTGPNQGYVFEAVGASQADDDGGSYGGVVFGYTDTYVRVFLPNNTDSSADNCASGFNGVSQTSGINVCTSCSTLGGYPCTHKDGYAVYVPPGYGGGKFTQMSHTVQVRVKIWSSTYVKPAYMTGGIGLTSNGVAYAEHFHYVGSSIDRVVVIVRGNSISPAFYSPGITAAQGTDIRPRVYGGVIYAFNGNSVRLWGPAQSVNSKWSAYGQACSIGDGWGNGQSVVNSQSVTVKVMFFYGTEKSALDQLDTSAVTISVNNNNEMPDVQTSDFSIIEDTFMKGYKIGSVRATDVDGDKLTAYSIISGNIEEAFEIDSTGTIILNNSLAVNYQMRQNFSLQVLVSDGVLADVGSVFIEVLYKNDIPVIHAPFGRAIRELSSISTEVGFPLNATNQDIIQSILFTLLPEGNYRNAFGISTCSGQIFVMNPDAIDYENITGFNGFNLSVMVTDDGPNAGNMTYRIPITVLNRNEAPYWDNKSPMVLNVTENSPVNTRLYPSLNQWCLDYDVGDIHYFKVLSAYGPTSSAGDDVSDYFRADNLTGVIYVNKADVLNYESDVEYTLMIRCTDDNLHEEQVPPNLYADQAVTITINDGNDPPIFYPSTLKQTLHENSPFSTVLQGSPLIISDEDVNDYSTFSIIQNYSSSNMFGIDNITGNIYQLSTPFNYEQVQSVYIIVQATDHGILVNNRTAPPKSTRARVNITILDVNEAPSFIPHNFSMTELTTTSLLKIGDVVSTVNGTDPDSFARQTLTFQITGASPSAAASIFKLQTNGQRLSANLVLNGQLSYEVYHTITLYFSVRDNGGDPSNPSSPGLSSTTGCVVITVRDLNDAPVLECKTVSSACLFSVNENTPSGVVLGQVRASDEDGEKLTYYLVSTSTQFTQRFSLNQADGLLTVSLKSGAIINYEVYDSYSFTVQVVDNSTRPGGPGFDQAIYTISVVDIPEAPFYTATNTQRFGVKGSAAVGSPVGSSMSNYFTDEDFGTVLRYSTSPTMIVVVPIAVAPTIFRIDSYSGQLYLTETPTSQSYSVDDMLNVTVIVTDGKFNISTIVQVRILDENTPPVLPPTNCTLPENILGPYTICKLNAIDAENNTIRYALSNSGISSTYFQLSSAGWLSLVSGKSMNYEVQSSFSVKVVVSDVEKYPQSTESNVQVLILDQNDSPVVSLSSFSIFENQLRGTLQSSTMTFKDEDKDSLFCSSYGLGSSSFLLHEANNAYWKGTITTTVANGQSTVTQLSLSTNLKLHYVYVTLDLDPLDSSLSYASNLMVTVIDAGAHSVVLTVWPTSWNSAKKGTYFHVPNVLASSLTGSGTWKIEVMNRGLVGSGSVKYTVDFEFVFQGRDPSISSNSTTCYLGLIAPLDYDTIPQIKVQGHVSDGKVTVSTNVTINVQNVNEPPVMSSNFTLSVKENSVAGTLLLDSKSNSALSVSDPENDELSFLIVAGNIGNIFDVKMIKSTAPASFSIVVAVGANIDFESRSLYTLVVTAIETKTVEKLTINTTVTVLITNVNDLTITSVINTAVDAFSRPNAPLQTSGGDTMKITGTNFGVKSAPETVVVTYGPTGSEYTAKSCAVQSGNNVEIQCISTAGVGLGHVWRVQVLSTGDIFTTTFVSGITTNYYRPVILNMTNMNMYGQEFTTIGGETIRLMGQDLGSQETSVSSNLFHFAGYANLSNFGTQFYIQDPMKDGYHKCRSALNFYLANVGESIQIVSDTCNSAGSITMVVRQKLALNGAEFSPSSVSSYPCSFNRQTDPNWSSVNVFGHTIDYENENDVIYFPAALLVVSTSSVSVAAARACSSDTIWRVYVTGSPRMYYSNFEITSKVVNTTSSTGGTTEQQTVVNVTSSTGETTELTLSGYSLMSTGCTFQTKSSVNCLSTEGVGVNYRARYIVAGSISDEILDPKYFITYHPPVMLSLNGSLVFDTRGYTSATPDLVYLRALFVGSNSIFSTYGSGTVMYGVASGNNYLKNVSYFAACSVSGSTLASDANGYRYCRENDVCRNEYVYLVTCRPTVGTGSGHSWKLSVGSQVSGYVSTLTSYKPPVLTYMNPDQWPFSDTAGGETIILMGDQFGPALINYDLYGAIDAFYGSLSQFESHLLFKTMEASCSVTSAHEVITCKVGEGTGKNHSWQLLVNGQYSNIYAASSSYAQPILVDFAVYNTSSSSAPANVRSYSTKGDEIVEIIGRNFGPLYNSTIYNAPISATALYTDSSSSEYLWEYTNCFVVIAHTNMICETSVGVGSNLKWNIRVDNQTNTIPTTSYSAPSLFFVEGEGFDIRDGINTRGGQRIRLNGENFGPNLTYVERIAYGPTGGEYVLYDARANKYDCEFVIPHKSFTCIVPEGFGQNHSFSIIVGGQKLKSTASVDNFISYKAPSISSLTPTYGTTQGAYTITVRGANFGPISGVVMSFWGITYSNYPMTYVSHEQVNFIVPVGQGQNRSVYIGHSASWCGTNCQQYSASYFFDYVSPQLDRLIFSDSSIAGYSNLTMYGIVQSSKPNVNGGSFGAAQTTSYSDDADSVSEFYNSVWIFPYNVSDSFIDYQLRGMYDLLALDLPLSSISSNFSARVCTVTESLGGYWTHNAVNCLVDVPNGTVVIGSYDAKANKFQRSESFLFREKSPVVYSPIVMRSPFPSDNPYPTTGGFSLNVTGAYFGALTTAGITPDGLDILLYLEGYMNYIKCQNLKVVSITNSNQETTLSCVIPPGQGKNVAIIVRRGGDGSKLVSDYSTGDTCKTCISFDPPKVTGFSTSPSSFRRSLAVSSFPVYSPTPGLPSLIFYGSNFGLPGGATVTVGGTRLLETGYHYHSNFTVVLTQGVGVKIQLSLQVANHDPVTVTVNNGQPLTVNYLPPTLKSASRNLLHTEGNELISLEGINFGASVSGQSSVVTKVNLVGIEATANYTGTVSLAGVALTITSWNHTDVTCITPESKGGVGKSISLTAGEQIGTLSGFSYYTPDIKYISITHAPTSGLTTSGAPIVMTIYGLDFGSKDANKYVTFGNTIIPGSELNTTHRTCDLFIPAGQGVQIPITITVEGQTSNTANFSYDPPFLVSMTPTIGSTSACSNWESQQAYLRRLDTDPTATRKCFTKELITFTGYSFGTSNMKIVVNNDLVCETDSTGKVISNWNCLYCDTDPTVHNTCYQSHTRIVIWAPQSYGRNLPVVLTVEGRRDAASTPVTYSYFPPEITSSNPGSISQGSDYINAKGQFISIYGTNMGGSQSWVSINFTGVTTEGGHVIKSCENAKWNSGATNNNDGFPYLTCTMPVDIVGGKNMTIHVADQTVNIPVLKNVENSIFVSACKTEYDEDFNPTSYYGIRYYNEFCLECPPGALCKPNEYQVDPKSTEGYWLTYFDVNSADGRDQCDKFRRPPLSSRNTCPVFLGCAPSEACLGSNTCDDAYSYVLAQCNEKRNKNALTKYNNNTCMTNDDCNQGAEVCKWNQPERCSYCDIIPGSGEPGKCVCIAAPQCSMCKINEYYRVNGKCIPCPQNVLLLIILFCTALLFFVIGSYILNKYKFNLSFVAIGFDYFQVLAIFAASDIVWPHIVVQMFSISLFFSFDINITAPECAYPDITYEQKWYVTMAMPFFGAIIFLLMFIAKLIHKFIWRRKRGWTALTKHGNQLIAMFVITLYYLYLPLLRKALEVMNCNPLVPSDGHVYTDWTSPNCGMGYCKCWEDRSDPQMQLVPWALLSLVIYSLGYPCYVCYIIYTNMNLIKEDQLLRAMGTGDTRATNPLAYDVRKKYHKLYYHFKPGKAYWMIYVLIRKFWIAVAALIFRTNPTFQLSFILLILFVCYVLQVQHRPFMSTVERESELERHMAKVEEARDRQKNDLELDEGMMLHLKIQRIIDTVEQKDEVLSKRAIGKRVQNIEIGTQQKITVQEVKNFFWDFNTVELYLLGCAIFVCISGIMFESENYSSNSGMRQSFLLLTFLVMLVIISSIMYFIVVFISEVLTTLGYDTIGWFEFFMSQNYKRRQELEVAQMEMRGIETSANPMNNNDAKTEEEKLLKEMELAKLADENEKLMKQVSELKKKEQLQRMSSFGAINPGGIQTQKKLKKRSTFESKDNGGENFLLESPNDRDML